MHSLRPTGLENVGFHGRPASLSAACTPHCGCRPGNPVPPPTLSLAPLSGWLPREWGCVALGKLLNTCDPNFPVCKRGIITVLWVEMTDTWLMPVTAATGGTWQGVTGSSSCPLSLSYCPLCPEPRNVPSIHLGCASPSLMSSCLFRVEAICSDIAVSLISGPLARPPEPPFPRVRGAGVDCPLVLASR